MASPRSPALVSLVILALGLDASLGCRRAAPPVGQATAAVPVEAGSVKVAAGSARRSEDVKAKEMIEVPAGRFFAGSLPGDEGRDPTLEPVAAAFDLPAFSIDALPWPGTPGTPPLTGVSQPEASRMCGERGARLCTELEWERACRGPAGDLFAAGPSWDPTCAQTPDKCVSGFGVRAMGTSIQEWTASPIATPKEHGPSKVHYAVKGSWASAPAGTHRCAGRHALEPYSGAGKPVGFRCCKDGKGSGASPSIPPIEAQPTFRRAAIEATRIAEIFSAIPELARVRGAPHLYKDTEISTVTEKAKSLDGFVVTTDPVLWSPEPGTDLLVMAGKSKGGAWVVALHRLPENRFRLASSMIFANEQGPIVLSWQSNVKKEIGWSMCWGCPGEFGAVTYREDHRVVVVQR